MFSFRHALATFSALLLLAGAGCGSSEPDPPEDQAAEVSAAAAGSADQQQLLRYGSEAAKELGWDMKWTGDYRDMVARRVIRARLRG